MDRSTGAEMKAFSYPFTLDPFGVAEVSEDQTKIYQDRVLTLLSTAIGERPMRPTYGTDIVRAMFENQSNAKKAIDAAIRKAIATWIPDITIENINITALNEDGTVGVSLNIILPDFTTTSVNILSTVLNPDGSTSRE